MAAKKTWCEKLADDKDLPKVISLEGKSAAKWGEGTMVIPRPREVDAVMKKVRKGMIITINDIREELAKEHGVNTCCPITTGIFAWIAAHAAEEASAEGRKRITPWWRTLKTGGELNPKYPGGTNRQRASLKAEGHRVVRRGKRYFVAAK